MATLEGDHGDRPIPRKDRLLIKIKNWDSLLDIMHSDRPICNLIPLRENPNVATVYQDSSTKNIFNRCNVM